MINDALKIKDIPKTDLISRSILALVTTEVCNLFVLCFLTALLQIKIENFNCQSKILKKITRREDTKKKIVRIKSANFAFTEIQY